MEEINRYNNDDTDEERTSWLLKRNGLDIKAFEINSGRHTLMRSVEDPNLGNFPVEKEYLMFLKSLLLESEPSSSLNEGDDDSDEEDDTDPQYMMFLKNLKEDGISYKLEVATKNRMVSVMYEGEDDSDEGGMQSLTEVKKVFKKKNVEANEDQIIGNHSGRVRNDVMEKTYYKSKAAKYMGNIPNTDGIGMRRSPRLGNNMVDSRKILRNRMTQNLKGDLKSRVVKKLKNHPIRMEVETHRSLRSGGHKHVECTRMDLENNRGREKGKPMEEKGLKTKRANHCQAKTFEQNSEKSRAKGDGLFGCNFQNELNEDDDEDDECYRIYLNSVKVEGDCIMYASKGQKPVKLEQFDVECTSDSDVLVTTNVSEFNEGGCNPFQTTKLFVTPENQLQCVRSREEEIESVFRKKLVAKLGEPYDDKEYKKLWDEINEERPKFKHHDLRGSGVLKQFATCELSPSYLSKFASLKKKIAAARDRCKRLNYLRGFFFWLQNVAHEDAFQPWFDKSCLELMENRS